MANVSLFYGTKAKLDETPYTDGAMYACTDENKLYIDLNNKRIEIGGVSNLNGSAYAEIIYSATPPTLPGETKMWVDTSVN